MRFFAFTSNLNTYPHKQEVFEAKMALLPHNVVGYALNSDNDSPRSKNAYRRKKMHFSRLNIRIVSESLAENFTRFRDYYE